MKQTEVLAVILVGIFVAVLGWVVTTTFISDPDERFEEVVQVRPFNSDFNQDALKYLQSNQTKIYTVEIDVEGSVGSGNETPFTGQ